MHEMSVIIGVHSANEDVSMGRSFLLTLVKKAKKKLFALQYKIVATPVLYIMFH